MPQKAASGIGVVSERTNCLVREAEFEGACPNSALLLDRAPPDR